MRLNPAKSPPITAVAFKSVVVLSIQTVVPDECERVAYFDEGLQTLLDDLLSILKVVRFEQC